MKHIIGTHLTIREQKDKENVVFRQDDIPSEMLRMSSGSYFCWINIYDKNMYGPMVWEEKFEESENEKRYVRGLKRN